MWKETTESLDLHLQKKINNSHTSQSAGFCKKYLSFMFSGLLISSSTKAEERTNYFWKRFQETYLFRETCSLLSTKTRASAKHRYPRGLAQHGEILFTETQSKHGPFRVTTFSHKDIFQKSSNLVSWVPSQWLLWNAPTREAFPKVMKNIQLTAWRLTLPSVSAVALKRNWQEKALTPGQTYPMAPSRNTNRCFSIGVLCAIRGGYQSLQFVWTT